MKKTIVIVGTLDTKGDEVDLLRSLIKKRGHHVIVIDTGILHEPQIQADVSKNKIALAGGGDIQSLIEKGDESYAQKIMAAGLKKTISSMLKGKKIQGILAIGGGQGSTIAAPTLKSLPLGLPKMLISTKISQAGVWPYIGAKDVMIVPPVADLAGINRLTRQVLNNAAGAMVGMVETPPVKDLNRPLVVLSMNGTVTTCGLTIKNILESEGYAVLVFHSIGTGGFALEEYVKSYDVQGVIELAVNEIVNDLTGGLASAGPDRLTAAGKRGIPQVIVPGSADFINFLGPETIPPRYSGRRIHSHNPQAFLVRTNEKENTLLGKTIADKLNQSQGPVVLLWPEKGLSTLDSQGKPFRDTKADEALLEALKTHLNGRTDIIEYDVHINDNDFAQAVVAEFKNLVADNNVPRTVSIKTDHCVV
ncbi:Tm-1-like ATP-binding domain-containing protein [Desulfobacula sp.]|uniref:Tm-1-like ATP-binding domain-containing protein n=1 Tax=Desulfobacula sp. TaxID=2593537 RepID=UPI00262EFE30|nr:Tm-1-like ATP-binding domain-containing protein [Desulfobacula sp.]